MSDIITVTMGALQTEFDNEVVRAVQNVGIYVDKEKLIEALQLAESLVRCKDCKHYSVEGETTRFGWCGYWNKPTDEMRYCSDGERKAR